MPSETCRVRFAPSPTGYLHVGGARTALFNWIYARHCGGAFLLRIEDTDKTRSTQEYFDSITGALHWLGLDRDDNLYIQSDNIEKHREAAAKQLENGSAYKCYCTPESLEKKRKEAQQKKTPYFYDGTCGSLSVEEQRKYEKENRPYAVRFRVPEGETVFNDVVHGRTVFQNSEIDDFIILRRNNIPTYQLAVVVDDHAMGITHVIRGDDHLSNTPKQILIYKALGWKVPVFAHMPMILGPDKARLSKRHGTVAVEVYRERGYLPEAIRNYIILLGWSPGDDREIITIDEVINTFHLEDTAKKSAVFDERKLLWMNGQYISALSETELSNRLKPYIGQDDDLAKLVHERGDNYLLNILTLLKSRLKLLTDFIRYGGYFYRDPAVYEPAAVKKYWKDDGVIEKLARIRLQIIECEDFSIEGIESAVRSLADTLNIPAAGLIHPTRLAITGFGVSPGLFEVMHILGKETIIRRLEKAVSFLNTI